ncbi:MAG TPA: amidohydrolase family protein, partial [Acidimicrobiales bacterium]|nr:amidohydrolase family protein [Acidimicrobiales bacterium]
MERTIPPPHPDPHAPRAFAPPPGACDAHCHVFGPAGRFPFAATRSYTPPDAGVDDLRRLHDRLGLDRAVLVQASCHGTDNAALLDALLQGKGHHAGVAMIDDATDDAELDELHEAGVRGTRINFVAHLGGAPDLERFDRTVARVAPRGWHVVLHFDAADLPTYAGLLDRMPCPYVIDHMARIDATAGLDQEPFRAL